MQASPSSRADIIVPNVETLLESVRGRKSIQAETNNPAKDTIWEEDEETGPNVFDEEGSTEESFDMEDSSEEESEEEEDEEWEERMCILKDARNLKKVAGFFLHPEGPVDVDAFASARCYFDRPSATVVEEEEYEERARIVEDAQALKRLAIDYMHPERSVVTQYPTMFGRNYFGRASAPQPEDEQVLEERQRILAEAKLLKQLARDYLHPECPVVVQDASLFGRNYFSRASAPEQEDMGMVKERELVLAEAKQLKKLAVDFLHPERPVVNEDPTLCGRNYFSRASAPEQEDMDLVKERKLKLAFLNYFARVAAKERELVLAEAKQLKKLAVDYLHPEYPVVVDDPTLFGRNYFSRASAPEEGDTDFMEEREQVLAEAQQLKKLAVYFFHPERPVSVEDPTVFGRNYFSRASADEQEDEALAQERELVLKEAHQLKKLAVDYLHPERPVVVEDPTLFGRNFFSRVSAVEQEDEDLAQERELVLKEAKQLKKFSSYFMHPELPVVAEGAAGRNFFSRAGTRIHDYKVHSFPAHVDDDHAHDDDNHNEMTEHFGMDEDFDHMFDDMREQLAASSAQSGKNKDKNPNDEEEGDLSRSPSSVMLYIGESIY